MLIDAGIGLDLRNEHLVLRTLLLNALFPVLGQTQFRGLNLTLDQVHRLLFFRLQRQRTVQIGFLAQVLLLLQLGLVLSLEGDAADQDGLGRAVELGKRGVEHRQSLLHLIQADFRGL